MDRDLRWGGAAERLSQKVLAQRLGITTRQVRNLEKVGLPYGYPKGSGSDKEYPWPQCNFWYIDFRVEAALKKATGPLDLDRARARKEDLLAQKIEIEIAKMRGDLVSLGFLRAQVGRVLEQVMTELRTFKGRWKHDLVDIPSSKEAEQRLEPMIESAIEAIRQATQQALLTEDSAGDEEDSDADGAGRD